MQHKITPIYELNSGLKVKLFEKKQKVFISVDSVHPLSPSLDVGQSQQQDHALTFQLIKYSLIANWRIVMSCCGGCGGQNIEKEKPQEKAVEQKPTQKPEQSQTYVELTEPAKK